MQAIEMLKREHRTIEHGLKLLEEAADRAQGEGYLEMLLDFFSEFADRRHHAKEEDILFAALEKRGMPRDGGPIYVMLEEHEAGRALRKRMAEALPHLSVEDGARQAFAEAARSFAVLLRQHIEKEDNVLYPMAENLLADADPVLLEQFEAADRSWSQSAGKAYSQILPDID